MPRRSIGRYLVPAIAGLVCYKIISRARDAPRHPKYESEQPSQSVTRAQRAPSQISDESWQRPNQEHERKEEDYWFWTKIAAVVASIGAVIAAAFAGGAFKASLDQVAVARRALVESSRPWLAIDQSVGTQSLSFDEDGWFYVNFGIGIKNIGHSPAQQVEISASVIPSFSITAERYSARSVCANSLEARGWRKATSTDVIFPEVGSQPRTHTVRVLTKGFISMDMAEAVRAFRTEMLPLLRKKGIEFVPLPQTIEGHFVNDFTVVGCVTYLSLIDDRERVHGSSFAFRVSRKGPVKDSLQAFDFQKAVAVGQENLRRDQSIVGAYAD